MAFVESGGAFAMVTNDTLALFANLDSVRRSEFLAGCRDVSPSLLGLVPFGLVALGVAARTRHPLAAIAVGMPVLWLAQWAIR